MQQKRKKTEDRVPAPTSGKESSRIRKPKKKRSASNTGGATVGGGS